MIGCMGLSRLASDKQITLPFYAPGGLNQWLITMMMIIISEQSENGSGSD